MIRIARVSCWTALALVALTWAAPNLVADTAPATIPTDPASAFERFQALAGTWRGESTKGWENRVRWDVIAKGSTVVSTSEFDTHHLDSMMTAYHLDGDELVLTHYCVAQNQPRLVASAIEDGGRRLTFTFRDGTNLASRDTGHMDKAVFHFIDDDHFTSQWTWYQDGAERWMEEIRYQRIE